jgi:hypothetical protein
MAEISDRVVVTGEMLTEAAEAGDLECLTVWARQGVRVTSAEALYIAAEGGFLEVVRFLVREMGADVSQGIPNGLTPLMGAARWSDKLAVMQCLVELGADINQATSHGMTPLMVAASRGHRAGVRCLVKLGAEVGAVDRSGSTALHPSARNGHYSTLQYLLEEAGTNMNDVNNEGQTVWDMLTRRLAKVAEGRAEADPLALAGLLRVTVLRGAPPPGLVALLSPEPARVVQEGARLRARLPAYLAHRRAYLDLRCPRISLLPGVLRALIYSFEGPATTEELWATGLGTAP